MFCPKCGMQNSDEANHCSNCGNLLKTEIIQETQNESQANFEQDGKDINNYPKVPNSQAITNPIYNQGTNSTVTGAVPKPKVDSNMVISIISLVLSVLGCGCLNLVSLILSIIGVVYASQVNTKLFAGDFEGAQKSSKTALTLSLISIGVMVLAVIICVILVVVFIQTGSYDQFKGKGNAL